jgi:hypothetical protein
MRSLFFMLALVPAFTFANVQVEELSYLIGKSQAKKEVVEFVQARKESLETDEVVCPEGYDSVAFIKGKNEIYMRLLMKLDR